MGGGASRYPYMKQLQALAACRPSRPPNIPRHLREIITPLKFSAWEQKLKNHQDDQFAQYVLSGIKDGFRIGFDYRSNVLSNCKGNMASALGHPEVIDSYLQMELEQGRMSVLSSTDLTTVGCHISSFGKIPKKSKPGSWRLIVNLSAPYGCCVNDGICKELSSLTYVSVDEVVDCLLTLGRGAQMLR